MVPKLVLLVAAATWVAGCSATSSSSGGVAAAASQADAGKDAGAAADSVTVHADAVAQDAALADGKADATAPGDGAFADSEAADSEAADSEAADSDATGSDATNSDAGAVADQVAATADVLDVSAADAAVTDAAGDATSDLSADSSDNETLPTDAGIADAQPADMAAGDAMTADLAGSATNIDLAGVVWTCTEPAWQAKACAAAVVTVPAVYPGIHVDLPTPITYSDVPPSSGTHRPVWGKWGEYSYLPPQRWVHNLEHGGLALLYHPCAPQATIDALRAFAKAQPNDEGGPFRWVMTPYPNLPTAVALVGWGHLYLAECANPEEMKTFIPIGYRKAPEDEGFEGGYSELWIGK